MILFDTTDAGRWTHKSGLARVSARLREALGERARPVAWNALSARGPEDVFLTPELFSEEERPGFEAFLARPGCRTAAIYHDAIPLKHPAITWPASVRRHPRYMELLSRFERVWAVSEASCEELQGYWAWMRLSNTPRVEVLPLGADGVGVPRAQQAAVPKAPQRIVCLGIIEPRKNQTVLLEAFERLGPRAADLELHFVGRVNPHFGKPIATRIRAASGSGRVFHHEAMDDAALGELLRCATATAFPSLAEGCGLPALESLWLGVPCLVAPIPALRESARGGGCLMVEDPSAAGWAEAIARITGDAALRASLSGQAVTRLLPTWAAAADRLAAGLAGA